MNVHLDEDMHVHSTVSDGRDTLQANVDAAYARGLRALGCVEHVRRSTRWVAEYVEDVHRLRNRGLQVTAGIEAKLLDTTGSLDMPPDGHLADLIYVADHKLPTARGCISPLMATQMFEDGTMTVLEALEGLIDATIHAVERHPRVVLAHLFSVLPKLGLDESDVPIGLIAELASAARVYGACIEIDERWRCPGPRTLSIFLAAGVEVLASTDSHRASTIGCYDYVASIATELNP